jgi:hypothetical protein
MRNRLDDHGEKAAALTLADPIEILARVSAQIGEPDRAIAALQKLLSIPGSGPLAENITRSERDC